MRILLATDGSHGSENAIHTVACRPWPQGTSVKVVSVAVPTNVFEKAYGEEPPEIFEQLEEAERRSAERAVETAVAALKSESVSDLDVRGEVVWGSPCERIVRAAVDFGADVLFIGSHECEGIGDDRFGSVAYHVVMRAPCSVEIVRAPCAVGAFA